MTARTAFKMAAILSLMTAGTSVLAQSNQFGVARFNWDGSLYLPFGGAGRTTTGFPPVRAAWPHATVISSGRVIVAGGEYHGQFALAAYRQSDGALDPTWGTGGRVQTTIGSGVHAEAYAAVVAGNGDLIVAGAAYHTDDYRSRFALVRYDYLGTELWQVETSFPDATDGGTTRCAGALPTSLFHTYSDRGVIANGDAARAVAIDANGRIVVAGYSRTATDGRIALARYDGSGVLDPAFDGDGDADGLILTNLEGNANAMRTDCEQANGLAFFGTNLVVAGSRLAGQGTSYRTEFLVLRYTASGSSHRYFGDEGVAVPFAATVDSIDHAFSANAVQVADNKILAAGRAALDGCCGPFFALVRLNPADGSLDTTFSGDGKVLTGFNGPLTPGEATAMAVRGTTTVTVAGWSGIYPGTLFVLARYNLSNGSYDTSLAGDGTAGTDFVCRNAEAATAIAIYETGPWQPMGGPAGPRVFVAGNVASSCSFGTVGE